VPDMDATNKGREAKGRFSHLFQAFPRTDTRGDVSREEGGRMPAVSPLSLPQPRPALSLTHSESLSLARSRSFALARQ